MYGWPASWYVAVVASFGNRGRRFLAGAVASFAFTLFACTPVMTTRYREVPPGGWEGARGETYRFELADGSNVDMRGARLKDHMVSGWDMSGGPALVDPREIRRVGIAFEEKDDTATTIKYLLLASVGYVGFLVGAAMLASSGGQ